MSTKNANVTPGKTFVPDTQGMILLTIEDLNRLGTPTVTVETTDSIETEDILDEAVTAAKIGALAVTEAKIGALAVTEGKIGAAAVSAGKLADAVADAIVTATATVGAKTSNTWTVTVQLKDIQGNSLSAVRMVAWWLVGSDVVGPTASSGLTSNTSYSQGTQVKAWTANYHDTAATNASGQLVLVFTSTGTPTLYFRCQVGSLYVNGTDTTDEAFSIDLAQWSKFAGMVDDLLAKAATAIEAEAKGKLKNKEKQNV